MKWTSMSTGVVDYNACSGPCLWSVELSPGVQVIFVLFFLSLCSQRGQKCQLSCSLSRVALGDSRLPDTHVSAPHRAFWYNICSSALVLAVGKGARPGIGAVCGEYFAFCVKNIISPTFLNLPPSKVLN